MKFFTLLALLLGPSANVEEVLPPTSLVTFGEIVQSACLPSESRRLQRDVHATAGTRKPGSAWAVVQAMLCGRDRQAELLALRHMPSSASVDRSTNFMLRGAAWGAAVISLDESSFAVSFTKCVWGPSPCSIFREHGRSARLEAPVIDGLPPLVAKGFIWIDQ